MVQRLSSDGQRGADVMPQPRTISERGSELSQIARCFFATSWPFFSGRVVGSPSLPFLSCRPLFLLLAFLRPPFFLFPFRGSFSRERERELVMAAEFASIGDLERDFSCNSGEWASLGVAGGNNHCVTLRNAANPGRHLVKIGFPSPITVGFAGLRGHGCAQRHDKFKRGPCGNPGGNRERAFEVDSESASLYRLPFCTLKHQNGPSPAHIRLHSRTFASP